MRQVASSYDEVTILPKFSSVDPDAVDLSSELKKGFTLTLPLITIGDAESVANAAGSGGLGIISLKGDNEDFQQELIKAKHLTIRALGLEDNEAVASDPNFFFDKLGVAIGAEDSGRELAEQMVNSGVGTVLISEWHGAHQSVVDQVAWLRDKFGDKILILVGDFATGQSTVDFLAACKDKKPDLFVAGMSYNVKLHNGVGVPTLSAVGDCANRSPVVAGGGIGNLGDVSKALAQGAKAVLYPKTEIPLSICKEPLQASLSYVGASNLEEFKEKAELILVSK